MRHYSWIKNSLPGPLAIGITVGITLLEVVYKRQLEPRGYGTTEKK